MIGSISGKLDEIEGNKIVVNCGGIGYEIFVTQTMLSKLGDVGSDIKVYTYLNINSRDNELGLFGFSSKDEKNMFLSLTSVSGVGPKTAISILGGISVFDLATAIASNDASLIGSIKGIGKKTAERIVLELKDRISKMANFDKLAQNQLGEEQGSEQEYAINVLLTLGINRFDATKKVRELYTNGDKAEEIIQKVLKSL